MVDDDDDEGKAAIAADDGFICLGRFAVVDDGGDGFARRRDGERKELQRDKERAKLERKKEKKREKKERNREKKRKAKQESSSSSSRIGNLISGGDNRELKTSDLQKDIGNEIVEHLENSSLSEEHGQPVCSQEPSYSSYGTQNNNKRKKSTSPLNGMHSLSSGWTEPEPIADDKTTTAFFSKLPENDIELRQFKNLILNCAPPTLHYDYDDQDWLFQRKHKCTRVKEKGEVSNDISCGTSALLPRAQYLDDAELYAFPFTIPF
ncbi:hypothetical protein BC332_02290 [Capsicum chinense]|nr:hypothetical protein BC332_02290 [Capsicum chinense]